ncbi:MAG: hypothetical protein K2M60_12140 [Lachnospiraceae bacterium]|nr:hypothetical protein [Lachnospiraceae bacterium]MDE6252620.1 hypothetical protein [Lachnospiraceae bacterium]
MSVSGIGTTDYSMAWYNARKTEKNVSGTSFAAQAAQTTAQTSPIVLHGSDKETGDIAVFSNAVLVNNSSITVYKTKDFDPNNPVYKVKIWDKDGNVTEQMVDVSKVDPKNSDTIDMYAYAAYLKDSGKGSFEDTVLKAGIAKYGEPENYDSFSFSKKMNWVDVVKDIMQSLYSYGNMRDYMKWQKFLGFLDK